MNRRLNFLLLPHYADQSIPMRTQAAEIFGMNLSKRHNCISVIKSDESKHFFWEDIEFYNLPYLKFIKKIFALAKRKKFDLIFIRDDLLLLILGLMLKRKYKIPILIHFTIPIKFITDFNHKWYSPKRLGGTLKHFLTLYLMRKVDLVLPTSEWMGKYLNSTGIDKKKIYNYPNGANLEIFKVTEYPSSNLNPTFIYIGAMSRIRQLGVLIRAMKIVCEKYKDAHLYMLGYGDNVQPLIDLTKELSLENNITFTGQIPYEEVPKYIEKSHITMCIIAPMYHYKLASPLKLFEYMSSSRPVIANKEIPAHIQPIRESKCGFLVDFNEHSISEGMINLFEKPEEAKQMGARGRKWLEENRTYKQIADDLEKEIFKLIS